MKGVHSAVLTFLEVTNVGASMDTFLMKTGFAKVCFIHAVYTSHQFRVVAPIYVTFPFDLFQMLMSVKIQMVAVCTTAPT